MNEVSSYETLERLFVKRRIERGSKIIIDLDFNASYIMPASKTGHSEDQEFKQEYSTAVAEYTGIINSKGKLLFALTSWGNHEVILKGMMGYKNGCEELDKLCNALYGQPECGVTTRNISQRDFDKLPNSMKKTGRNCWLSTKERQGEKGTGVVSYQLKFVDDDGMVRDEIMTTSKQVGQENPHKNQIWPILLIPMQARFEENVCFDGFRLKKK